MLNFLMDIILFFPRLIFKSVAYMISFIVAIIILFVAVAYCTKQAVVGNGSTTEHRVIEHHVEHRDQKHSQ